MSEWSTYTLSDLLMFSARTYYRLIELYNLATWPLHLLAAGAGVALVLCAQRADERSGRIAAVLLGLCWLWVAWAFHAERYATINSAAPYFAAGFAIQGTLLVFAGNLRANRDRFGLGLLLLALLGYPLLALLSGRPWPQAEMFGIAPDPTAAATLALLALSPRASWVLWPVPLLWSAVSGATLWTMQVRHAWVLPLLALLVMLRRLYLGSR
ncbi:MAG TPA: DUF6064 family protein [Janthinobacterium sp.]|nr:DUF6064 family protein [Janthinobacterium sp.]